MSRIYYHNTDITKYDKENVQDIVNILEDYLCDYKLAFHCIYVKKKGYKNLVRLDINKLGSKSLLATYSFTFNTLSKFHRKKYLGSISYDEIVQELERR